MYSLTTLLQLAQLGTIGVGFLGIAVALRSHRRQMHAQMFLEFSSRFHDVLGSMAVDVWKLDAETAVERSSDLTRSCLQCFHTVANLFHLNKAGYISQDLWKPWQRGFRRMIDGAVLREEWLALEPAFGHIPKFRQYMRELMGEKSDGRRSHGRQVAFHARHE